MTSLKSEELKGNEIKITKEKIIESIPENLNSVHVNDNENKKNLANINNNNKPIIDLKITTKNDFNIVKKEDLQKTIEKENEKIEEFFKNLPNYEFLFSEKILLKNKQKI